MADETVFTLDQVNEAIEQAKQKWIEEELAPIEQERNELMKHKPVELTPEQKEIQQLKADLLQQKVVSALQQHDLQDFLDFLDVNDEEELQHKVNKLTKVLDERKLNNSYVPRDHKATDAYTQAEKSNNVQGMISAKLSNLFK